MAGRGRWLLVGAIAAFVPASLGLATADPAAAADDGVRYEAHTSYLVDIDAQAVRVTLDATFTNELADFYFPRMPVPVLAEATNFVATTADGRRLGVTRNESGDGIVTTVDIDLEPDLLSGQSEAIRLTYDLPSLAPRSEGFTRVNAAYATFAAFTAGDPNLASVEILVPEGFEIEHVGADVETSSRDGYQVLSSGPLADPPTWSLVVVARNDDGLFSRDVDVGGRAFVVRAWPGDDEWAGFVETNLRDGIPVLEDLVGEPWPSGGALTIVEAASPYVYGYAGWFLPADRVVEVGDALDRRVILHELGHLWFNDAWFSARWIGEGFAEEYATRTLAALGDPLTAPEPVRAGDPAAVRLAEWGQPTLSDETIRERELYGYNTSFLVLRTVADEIGADALRAVIDAAADRTIAYRGDPSPETVDRRVDSRRLLDLLEEVGGSSSAAGVFEQYVLTGNDVTLLPERAAARTSYDALTSAGNGWTPPLPVRLAMDEWDFAKAEQMIADAQEVLGARDVISRLAAELDLDLPPSFEDAYESSADLEAVIDDAEELRTAVEAIGDADDAVHASRGLHERIGLWGSDPEGDLDDARAAFENGDGAGAISDARDAIATLDGAGDAGIKRVGGAAGMVVLAAALAWTLRRRFLRHRTTGTVAG